jgi:hypothetical protein
MFPILTNFPKRQFFGFVQNCQYCWKNDGWENFSDLEKLPDAGILPISKNCAQKRKIFGFQKIASLHVSLKNCPMTKFFGIQKNPGLHVSLIFSFFL